MPTYSIWRDASGDLTLVQGTASPRFINDDEQDATHALVRLFNAETWEQAVETLHQYQDACGRGA